MSYSDYVAELLISSESYVRAANKEDSIKTYTGEDLVAYLSCRRLITSVKEREIIENILAEVIKDNFSNNITIVGLATAGITWSHAIALKLALPMLYTRKEEKKYGLPGLIEGNLEKATDEAVLVDDVLYTGDSVKASLKALKEKGIKVIGIVCIALLNYKIKDTLEKEGIKVIELTDYNNILVLAEKIGMLDKNEIKYMKEFYEGR